MNEATAHTNRLQQPKLPSGSSWKTVNDPEVPVLSVLDLGIVRNVQAAADGGSYHHHHTHVFRLPGYGCHQHGHSFETY